MLSRRSFLHGLSASTLAAMQVSASTPANALFWKKKRVRPPFGAAVRAHLLGKSSRYTKSIAHNCEVVVPESALKWHIIRKQPGKFDFKDADQVMRFAARHKMRVRGHTLVWHGAMPEWTKQIDGPKQAEAEMRKHMELVVPRYAGQIKDWDVVNEPIDDQQKGYNPLRNTLWRRTLGNDYVEIALRMAADIAPDTQLVINEYDIESLSPKQTRKRAALLNLLRHLMDKGAPLHAVGLQCHLKAQHPIDKQGLTEFLTEIKDMGLKVIVSELDVLDHKLPGPIRVRDAIIASRVYDLLDTMFEVHPPQSVLTWGISDRYSWVPHSTWFKRDDKLAHRPLPLDRNYRPKPFMGVIKHFCGKEVAPTKRKK